MSDALLPEIQLLLDRHTKWLRDKTTLRQLSDWVQITTPFLDRHNDHLQIYTKPQGNGFILTDDGYTLRDLEMQGCNLDTPKRKSLLRQVLNGFSIKLISETGALETTATAANFPQRKHALTQAMLAVNDLFYLASPNVAHLFYEDVIAWLEENDVRFTPSIKFAGTSGYDHMFDFVIPKSRTQPERILQTVSRPNKIETEGVILKWFDTRDSRPDNSKMFALLNDLEHPVQSGVEAAMENYGINPVRWSRRGEVVADLAA